MAAASEKLLKKVAAHLPSQVRSLGKRLYYRDRHWANPALKGFGTVQDQYYWVADGNLDTLLLLQNYFSALFPTLNTGTQGVVTLYDSHGQTLGAKPFQLASNGSAKVRVSSLMDELEIPHRHTYGTVEVHISIPRDVLDHVQDQKSMYFWDRFYISYVNGQGQICFVHGVDKTLVYQDGQAQPSYWYGSGSELEWAPEIPVNIEEYAKFSVIMINRSGQTKRVSLALFDVEDKTLSWEAEVEPKGVHRFELTKENTAGLIPTELRMRVKGMATQYGRPVVFKEFPNGAISAMHC